jgi:Flp pilus assembly protein TadD
MQMENLSDTSPEGLENMEQAFADPDVNVGTKVAMLAEYRQNVPPEELGQNAIKLARLLTSAHPNSGAAWAVCGDIYQAVGQKANAKNAYIKALEFEPGNLQLWQNSLQLLTELDRSDSVLLIAEKALEVYPNQAVIYYYNGLGLLRKRRFEEATYVLEQGKRLSGSNLQLIAVFNSLLGEAYNGTGDFVKSDRAFEAALENDPENYSVMNNYSYFLALRGENLERAETLAEKAAKKNPDNIQYLDTYAWVLFTMNKYKDAARVMEKVFKDDNVSAVHYEHYGDILFKLGEVDQAVNQWKKALELSPGSKEIERKIAEKTLYE